MQGQFVASASLNVNMAGSLSLLFMLVACVGTTLGRSMPKCPDKTPMQNFDFQAFHGTWIWVKASNDPHIQQGATCFRNIIQDRDNGTTAFITKIVEQGASEYRTMEGNIMRAQDSGTDGELELDIPSHGSLWRVKYLVLGTDNTNYAATWACWVDHQGALQTRVYVMSRHENLPDDSSAVVDGILQSNHIDPAELVAITQTNCPASSE